MASPWLAVGAGASEGLEQLIARTNAEKWKQAAADAQLAQQAESARHNQAAEGYQQRQLQMQGEANSFNRQMQTDRFTLDKNKGVLENMRLAGPGMIAPEQMQAGLAAGMPPSNYEQSGGEPLPMSAQGQGGSEYQQGPSQPGTFFKGDWGQQKSLTDAKAAADRQEADRAQRTFEQNEQSKHWEADLKQREREQNQRHADELAKLQAESTKPKGLGYTMSGIVIPTQAQNGGQAFPGMENAGTTGDVRFASDGSVISASPKGLSTAERAQERTAQGLLGETKTLRALGDKIGWRGFGGPIAGMGSGFVQNQLARNLGPNGSFTIPFTDTAITAGTPQESAFRTMLSRHTAKDAHDLYGSAFTKQEAAMLNTFVAGINVNPNEAETRLIVEEMMIQNRLDALNRNQQTPEITIDRLFTALEEANRNKQAREAAAAPGRSQSGQRQQQGATLPGMPTLPMTSPGRAGSAGANRGQLSISGLDAPPVTPPRIINGIEVTKLP